MSFLSLFLYGCCAAAAVSAILILFTRQILHAALLLLICLLSLAALFVILNAGFLAITQILVYAGGVLLLLVFGIMLTSRLSGSQGEIGTKNLTAGLLIGGALTVVLMRQLLFHNHFQSLLTSGNGNITEIGIGLITTFAAPFELSGILLLISLIGAMSVASMNKKA